MQIVLPGGLVDSAIAPTLAPHVEEKAPRLTEWLRHAQAAETRAAVAETLCTPLEYWWLRENHFEPRPGQVPAAGLAALHARDIGAQADAPSTPDAGQPLWLAQLVHVAPARDGAALIPAGELEITPDESLALFESAAEFFEGSGFDAVRFDTQHWRVAMPEGYDPQCASPALVSTTSVNDWWKQDVAGRPWRRLINELQMLWFDHSVNRDREARGLRPVNSLWLYGGAAPEQLKRGPSQTPEPRVLRSLQGPALVQDWGSWLMALEQLDAEVLAGLNASSRVVLTGEDRIVELTPGNANWLNKLLNRKRDWKKWWSAKP